MLALTVLWFASALSQTSALHVHSAQNTPTPPHLDVERSKEAGMPEDTKYDIHNNVVDPGTRIYTRGSEETAHLPHIYGQGPRILGLNHCVPFQQGTKREDRQWGAAGMPNTGTNALYNLMSENCEQPTARQQTGGWQVPWGKHNFLHQHTIPAKSTLAVVLAKDPLQWMASTCRQSYFSVSGTQDKARCPSPVNHTMGHYFTFAADTKFSSLIEVWSKWHAEYFANHLHGTQPALVIRFEDLLFKPEETVAKVCNCMGFKAKSGKDFKILESISKWGSGHGNPTNRTQTLAHYTTKRDALMSHLTPEDVAFMKQELHKWDGSLFADWFHYQTSDWELAGSHASQYHSLLNNAHISELLATSDWGDDE